MFVTWLPASKSHSDDMACLSHRDTRQLLQSQVPPPCPVFWGFFFLSFFNQTRTAQVHVYTPACPRCQLSTSTLWLAPGAAHTPTALISAWSSFTQIKACRSVCLSRKQQALSLAAPQVSPGQLWVTPELWWAREATEILATMPHFRGTPRRGPLTSILGIRV